MAEFILSVQSDLLAAWDANQPAVIALGCLVIVMVVIGAAAVLQVAYGQRSYHGKL